MGDKIHENESSCASSEYYVDARWLEAKTCTHRAHDFKPLELLRLSVNFC